jgi:hypothetical protein
MATVSYEHNCECGRRYRVEAHKLPARDADSVKCSCGRIIKEWRGAEYWSAIPLEDHPEDAKEKSK